jgi:3'-5' exoribonuclease
LQTLVEHLIISHHGKYEFGSPKLPMFPEALLLHQLDDMDSKMQSMHTQLESEPSTGTEWTSYNRSLERPLLRTSEWLK